MRLPKETQYPKTVLIGNEQYLIKFLKRLPSDKGGSTMGDCDSGKKLIRIRMGLSAKERLSTYIHEVLHAMEFEYEIPIKHEMVYELETAITDFLIANI
jgi:hypothetical protein